MSRVPLVTALLVDYAACIDNDALEDWPGFFVEEAQYTITTAHNHDRDLPIGLIHATSRAMLEDRVTALRRANIYEPQRYRHIVSVPRVTGDDGAELTADTGFLVVRIMHSGETEVFATGRYLDRIDITGSTPLFREKIVVLDSDKVDTLLAIPL